MPLDLILPTYFVTWWITLFMLLPIGLKPIEDRKPEEYAAAPANPNLKKKIIWNTGLAAVVTGLIHVLITLFSA